MADNPRIEELRRRIEKDPASIAFAQLAEEYRRAGRHAEAVEACRAGLRRHPGYLSARVTLGRALIELNQLDEAREHLEAVLRSAPENLAAIRGLGDIHHRRGELHEALARYKGALDLARFDPDLEQTVGEVERELGPERTGRAPSDGLTFAQATAELMSAFDLPSEPVSTEAAVNEPAPAPLLTEVPPIVPPIAPPKADPERAALGELERFLAAILAIRAHAG